MFRKFSLLACLVLLLVQTRSSSAAHSRFPPRPRHSRMARPAARARATTTATATSSEETALPGDLDKRANTDNQTLTRTRTATSVRTTIMETVTLAPRSGSSGSIEEADANQYQAIVTLGLDGWPGAVMIPFEADEEPEPPQITPGGVIRVAEVSTSTFTTPELSSSIPSFRKLRVATVDESVASTLDEGIETPVAAAETPEATPIIETPGASTVEIATAGTTEEVPAPAETNISANSGTAGGNNATSPLPSGGMSPCEISVYTYDAASNCASIFNTAGACGLSTYFPEAMALPLPRLAVPEAIWNQHGASQHNTLCGSKFIH
jgi:hypothetical protein